MSNHATTKLIPHLCCRNASEAVDFYEKALGAEKLGIFKLPDGRVMHAALKLGEAMFYLTDEWPKQGALSPLSLGNTAVTLHLQVADCDAIFDRAVANGCKVQMPLQDMFWGDRYGLVADPYGHKWSIATTIRKVSTEELQAAASAMGECLEPATVAE